MRSTWDSRAGSWGQLNLTPEADSHVNGASERVLLRHQSCLLENGDNSVRPCRLPGSETPRCTLSLHPILWRSVLGTATLGILSPGLAHNHCLGTFPNGSGSPRSCCLHRQCLGKVGKIREPRAPSGGAGLQGLARFVRSRQGPFQWAGSGEVPSLPLHSPPSLLLEP